MGNKKIKQQKGQLIQNITDYLTNENFPKKHLKALLVLISLFIYSSKLEQEVFSFIKNLKEKYYL